MSDATIYALASAPGRAGVAVIRVSGRRAGAALEALAGRPAGEPRRLLAVIVRDPATGAALDRGLAAWFPGPHSFTGEDVAELHVHGGVAVVSAVLAGLAGLDGLRLAQPGEFARRAFENGKMDLTAAEGLADLVNAETEAQRRQALRQLQGELGALYEGWRGRLLRALAHHEATIDFSDEDLPEEMEGAVRGDVAALEGEIAGHLADDRRGERLREGVRLAIIGPPNSGKSSLFNLLARRDAVIVSETAGTTRDVVEMRMDLGGYPLVVADTAGLRETADGIEREGVRRAERQGAAADLKLAVFDGAVGAWKDPATAALVDADTLAVINKRDLGEPAPPLEVNGREVRAISVHRGDGIEGLIRELSEEGADRCLSGGSPLLTRARHREALGECREALGRFAAAGSSELAAEDLRLAARALGRITGRVGVEDILDVIFEDFCIGK